MIHRAFKDWANLFDYLDVGLLWRPKSFPDLAKSDHLRGFKRPILASFCLVLSFANGWIVTTDLKSRKRPLYQPSHNHLSSLPCLVFWEHDYETSGLESLRQRQRDGRVLPLVDVGGLRCRRHHRDTYGFFWQLLRDKLHALELLSCSWVNVVKLFSDNFCATNYML